MEHPRIVDGIPILFAVAVLIRTGNLTRAHTELTRVLSGDPENANAHTNFGLLLARQGQMQRASVEFREALRINPRQRQAAEALRTIEGELSAR